MMNEAGSFNIQTVTIKRTTAAPSRPINIVKIVNPIDELVQNNQLTQYYNTLKTLTYTSKKLVFDTPLTPGATNILYNILYKLTEYIKKNDIVGLGKMMDMYMLTPWITEDDLFYAMGEFDISIYKHDKYIESYHDKLEIVSSGQKCRRKECDSIETVSVEKQTRSRDEGETVKYVCMVCGYTWGN